MLCESCRKPLNPRTRIIIPHFTFPDMGTLYRIDCPDCFLSNYFEENAGEQRLQPKTPAALAFG